MTTDFLIKPLNEMFSGRGSARKQPPKTKVIAVYQGEEYEVSKWRNGLWGVNLDGQHYANSKLGDLIHQLEGLGAIIMRVSA